MALQGDVETIPLRHLLGWLAERRASGTLSLNRGTIARRFHLLEGQVMLSSTSEEEMRLGRLLVARGLIDAAQLEAALDTREGTRRRLGSALTRAGLLSATTLRGVLTEKVRRLLVDALNWTDGGFLFDDAGPLPSLPGVAAIVDLADVLAMPADIYTAAGPDDVIVTDEDIVESLELTLPRPPARPRPAPKRKAAPRSSARGPRRRTNEPSN